MSRPSILLAALIGCTAQADQVQPPPDRPVPAEPVAFVVPAEAVDHTPDDLDRVTVRLTAAPHSFEVAGQAVQGWAYNAQVPGPTIRLVRGQTLRVELDNALPDPTTIHWHGLHVPFAMDGATWMHDPVQPGERFVYEFPVDQVGTFWYHPHFDTARQVDLGLYGAIVVVDPQEPQAEVDVVAILDSWDEVADRDDHHGLDGVAPVLTINGVRDPELAVPAGATVRLRWINAANIAYVGLSGAGLRTIGGDQGLFSAPREGVELLTPGERLEHDLAIGDASEILAHPWSLYGGALPHDPERLLSVVPEVSGPPPDRLPFTFDGRPPSQDPPFTDLVYVLHGDPTTGDWRINGERFPDITPHRLPLDADVVIEVRNLSASEHPFHLHGHAFELLSRNRVQPPHREVHDTFNVAVHEIVRLRLIADNPGHWMVHCHILPHADDGMMTILEVGDMGGGGH